MADEPELDLEGAGPSQFGEWLLATRKAKNLTRAELAEKSDVSLVQIYNLETGRSQNPRERTREKLRDALDEALPQDVVESTAKASEIQDVGELEDFDPHDENDRPEEAGVYVFYDISDRAIYIGQSQNIKKRIEDHYSRFYFKPPIVQRAAYVKIEDKALREKVERIMIKFLRSNAVLNKQNVDRD